MTKQWTAVASLLVALGACGSGEAADGDPSAADQTTATAAAAASAPVTVEEAENLFVSDYIDGEEELVSIDLEEVDENEFAGEMRWTHPVGGDLTADCTATMERGSNGQPYALFSTCQVRE